MKPKSATAIILSKVSEHLEQVVDFLNKEDLSHGIIGLIPGGSLVDSIFFRNAKKRAEKS